MECSECGHAIAPGEPAQFGREGYVAATETRRAVGYVLCADCAGRTPDALRRKDG